MYSDNELLTFLLSRQKETLAKAIGKRLIEVKRFFEMDISSFLKYTSFKKVDFFSYNTGAVQFYFEDRLIHALAVYGEQLSIVLLPETLTSDGFAQSYRLSKMEQMAPELLKECLGKVCQDVRIWTLREEFESEEAKQTAISYLLSNGQELFYCIYLHEDLDSDYLLLEQNIHREKVASCFSLLLGEYIDPPISIKSSAQSFTH